jgi:hypothetical protein
MKLGSIGLRAECPQSTEGQTAASPKLKDRSAFEIPVKREKSSRLSGLKAMTTAERTSTECISIPGPPQKRALLLKVAACPARSSLECRKLAPFKFEMNGRKASQSRRRRLQSFMTFTIPQPCFASIPGYWP